MISNIAETASNSTATLASATEHAARTSATAAFSATVATLFLMGASALFSLAVSGDEEESEEEDG